jgi:hypothetical protein
MPTTDELDFDDIERDATGKLDLVKLKQQMQAMVDVLYPGYRVVLSKNGIDMSHCRSRSRVNFGDLTQMKQIETVLEKGPLELNALFKELETRGSKIGFQSLMSLLSAGKRSERFRSFGRGIWGLSEHIRKAVEMGFDNLEEKE